MEWIAIGLAIGALGAWLWSKWDERKEDRLSSEKWKKASNVYKWDKRAGRR